MGSFLTFTNMNVFRHREMASEIKHVSFLWLFRLRTFNHLFSFPKRTCQVQIESLNHCGTITCVLDFYCFPSMLNYFFSALMGVARISPTNSASSLLLLVKRWKSFHEFGVVTSEDEPTTHSETSAHVEPGRNICQ